MPQQTVPRTVALFAHAYALAGSPDDAMRLFGELEANAEETYIEPVAWAFAYLATRDREQALRWIEMAGTSWTNNSLNIFYLKNNVFEDPLLEEADFVEARQQLGYEEF